MVCVWDWACSSRCLCLEEPGILISRAAGLSGSSSPSSVLVEVGGGVVIRGGAVISGDGTDGRCGLGATTVSGGVIGCWIAGTGGEGSVVGWSDPLVSERTAGPDTPSRMSTTGAEEFDPELSFDGSSALASPDVCSCGWSSAGSGRHSKLDLLQVGQTHSLDLEHLIMARLNFLLHVVRKSREVN